MTQNHMSNNIYAPPQSQEVSNLDGDNQGQNQFGDDTLLADGKTHT